MMQRSVSFSLVEIARDERGQSSISMSDTFLGHEVIDAARFYQEETKPQDEYLVVRRSG